MAHQGTRSKVPAGAEEGGDASTGDLGPVFPFVFCP